MEIEKEIITEYTIKHDELIEILKKNNVEINKKSKIDIKLHLNTNSNYTLSVKITN